MTDASIVEYTAEHGGHRCGYCHSSNTNFSHGMWAHRLSVEDYQDMIDRGWRRSGKYTYKPTMKATCCPQYPIRCAVAELRLTKSQKKAIKRVNRYLNYGIHPGNGSAAGQEERGHEELNPGAQKSHSGEDLGVDVKKETPSSVETVESGKDLTKQNTSISAVSVSCQNEKQKSHTEPKPGLGHDPSKPLAKKAKLMRLERKQAKLPKTTSSVSSTASDSEQVREKDKKKSKTLEDYINDVIDKPAHTLELRLVCSSPRSQEFDQKFASCHQIYHKYQTTIHCDPPEKPNEHQYTRFLVGSPLFQPEHLEGNKLPQGYGSFHQHYILDGKVIAVGVIDILPRCVSSVYFYYDPDYAFLSLGTYSALRELEFTRSLHQLEPSIAYYYLGFYIHSCPKMKYKGQYVPSFLSCPETYKWFPLEECRRKLDAQKYSRFAPENMVDDDELGNLDEVMCLHQRTAMSYGTYRARKPRSKANVDHDEVKQYASFVGATCARRMLLFRK